VQTLTNTGIIQRTWYQLLDALKSVVDAATTDEERLGRLRFVPVESKVLSQRGKKWDTAFRIVSQDRAEFVFDIPSQLGTFGEARQKSMDT
jgi:hypothetical protein